MGNIVKASTIAEAVETLGEPLKALTFRFGFDKSGFDVPKFRDEVAAIGFLYYDEETETFRSRKTLYAKRTDDDIKFYSSHVCFPKQTILDITDFTVLSIEGSRLLVMIHKEFDGAFLKENTVTECFGCNSVFDFNPTKTEKTFGPLVNYIIVDDDSTILLSDYKKLNLRTTERDPLHSFYINLVENYEIKMDNIITSDTMAVCADVLSHNGFDKVKWITEMSNLKIVAFTIRPDYEPNLSNDIKLKIQGMLVERIDQE